MKTITDIDLFKILLHRVEKQYESSTGYDVGQIKSWKGQEIIHFQDDLRSKTGSTISEKWFYTYVKNNPEKLPRIDILNMLAQYIGEDNWHAFAKAEHKQPFKIEETRSQHIQKPRQLRSKKPYIILILVVVIMCISWIYSFMNSKTEYEFCFIDFYSKSPIENKILDIKVLNENESPQYFKTDSLGCFKGTTSGSLIKFVVSSPYYKNDTITRVLNGEQFEQLPLRTDDYALMLDYYSNGKVEEFKKRKAQLNQLIARDAIIMEVLPHSIGVTLYEKADFINKLTTPTSTLKRLEIIETTYRNEQITKLKFRIQR
ncbi:hypothetical protein LX97_03390 [Nonlabens dokdonensis]|uniref:Uncharacterized protein n=2 Tax=Nonlabens dokdonensis TaxID=328515 RepID=L7W8B9_NONDD|nr:hypothetical protein [Nonlabens dokdonensis]AGC77935.1 hypothetical protein DDD_2808 [Nonlabens dokdonensis DSW-6]PZX36633.1 hypothetical protein LX97_03390 [Nonlabens dokdonensis]